MQLILDFSSNNYIKVNGTDKVKLLAFDLYVEIC